MSVLLQGIKFIDEHNGFVTALATAFIGGFTATLWGVNRRQGFDTRTIQRAYVKISHPPPGVERLDDSGNIWLTISIKNYGQTPATVSDVVLRPLVVPRGEPLPRVPNYSMEIKWPVIRAFLVTNDEFFLSRFCTISTDEMSKVKGLISDLYLVGFVDYIDKFRQRHRGGYARQYQPMMDKGSRDPTERDFAQLNNLTVVAQDGYNYDRVRLRGEGGDWSRNI
jgi:hypothetical protein